MELSAAQEQELESILKQHPIGITHDKIFEKCTTFPDKINLSRGIHQMTQLGRMYKNKNLYFLVGVEIPEEAPPKREEPVEYASRPPAVRPVPPPEPKVTPEPAPKAPEAPPMGDLPHTVGVGAAALALFRLRREPFLLLPDLLELTGAAKTTLYNALTMLVTRGYAEKDDTNIRYPKFRWSGKFRYPFSVERSSDDTLLAMSIKVWLAKHRPEEVEELAPIGSPGDDDGSDNAEIPEEEVKASLEKIDAMVAANPGLAAPSADVPAAIRILDAQIASYEAHLASLRQIRNTLVPA